MKKIETRFARGDEVELPQRLRGPSSDGRFGVVEDSWIGGGLERCMVARISKGSRVSTVVPADELYRINATKKSRAVRGVVAERIAAVPVQEPAAVGGDLEASFRERGWAEVSVVEDPRGWKIWKVGKRLESEGLGKYRSRVVRPGVRRGELVKEMSS